MSQMATSPSPTCENAYFPGETSCFSPFRRFSRPFKQAVSGFHGIGSLNMDMKDKKLTVSGDFDPVKVVNNLRKSWHAEIVSVGPAKEEDGKKDEGKKNEDQVLRAYQACYSTPHTYYYMPYCEETPNCVIC